MSTRTIARIGFSALAALTVLFSAVASGYTQSNDPVYLPMIQHDDQAVGASHHRDDDKTATPRPTIVLVHGAWADSAGWSDVTARLLKDGYPVWAVPNLLRGISSDAAYVKGILETISGPIVLVAHSYGGAVITNAATGSDNVKALVYIDGFAPKEGETGLDLLAMPPPAGASPSCVAVAPEDLATVFNIVPYPDTGVVDLYIKQEVYPTCFANTIGAKEAAVLATSQRPFAASVLTEASGPPAWVTIPSWYMIGTLDKVIPPYLQRIMAERANAQIVEVRAPHPAMISHPKAVADLIETAAKAVAAP